MSTLPASALFPLAVAAVLLVGLLAAIAWAPLKRDGQLRRQLAQVRDAYGPAAAAAGPSGLMALVDGIAGPLGRTLTRSGLLSAKTLRTLENTLTAAGLRGAGALPAFVGAKVMLLAVLGGLGWMLAHRLGLVGLWARLLPAVGAVLGLLLPDLVLRVVRGRYVAAVERAMPDALDLLVICAEAGLALEQGMERVAREIAATSPPCALELKLTHDELRIFADRRTALVNLGRRTGWSVCSVWPARWRRRCNTAPRCRRRCARSRANCAARR